MEEKYGKHDEMVILFSVLITRFVIFRENYMQYKLCYFTISLFKSPMDR